MSIAWASWTRSAENVTRSRTPFSTENVATAAKSFGGSPSTNSFAARRAATHGLGLGEREIEEQQEVPARGRLDDLRSARLHSLLREIDAVERDDLLPLAVVEDLEVLLGEIPQGIAVGGRARGPAPRRD